MNYKLTSVKILKELYKNFKSSTLESEFTLQKLVNRSMDLYVFDEDFQNKIQVFYPYLKHSVEVNQVVQLFLNLNKFIQPFNTISIDNYYESKIDVNKEIGSNEIPEPIKYRLHSIYDVKEFIT